MVAGLTSDSPDCPLTIPDPVSTLTLRRGSVVAEFTLLSEHVPSLTPQEAGYRLQQRLQEVMTSPAASLTANRVDVRRELSRWPYRTEIMIVGGPEG